MLKQTKHTRKKTKGQSTVEYIILVSVILGALIIFLQKDGAFQTAFNGVLGTGTNGMVDMSNRLSGSWPAN